MNLHRTQVRLNVNKKQLREVIQRKLKRQDPKERERKSQLVREALLGLDAFKKSRCLLIYVSTPIEVDTHCVIEHCLRTGKRVVVPKMIPHRGTLELREMTHWTQGKPAKDQDELEQGALQVLEPRPDRTRAVSLDSVDTAVLPGVAFDSKNHRLGRGEAYFDKLLAELPPDVPRIALAYDFQCVEAVPFESHDEPVHRILSA